MKKTTVVTLAFLLAGWSAPAAQADTPGEARRLRAQNEALKAALADSRNRIARLRADLADLQATVRQMQAQVAALESRLAAGRAAAAGVKSPAAPDRRLDIRVEGGGWGNAGRKDIQKVLLSAAGELWKHFPERRLAPIVVRHGSSGPIVLFRKGDAGEYIVKLDVEGLYWCQFAYQFAHEFCHILANYSPKASPKNKWFEESLCEMASIYAVRRMATTWQTRPPYPHWRSFSSALKKYADDLLRKGEKLTPDTTLADWYRRNRDDLRKDSCLRDKNRVVALQLLPLFEADPSRWEAVGYLNHSPSDAAASFKSYLAAWHGDAPARHKPFIRQVAKLFGVELAAAAVTSEPSPGRS